MIHHQEQWLTLSNSGGFRSLEAWAYRSPLTARRGMTRSLLILELGKGFELTEGTGTDFVIECVLIASLLLDSGGDLHRADCLGIFSARLDNGLWPRLPTKFVSHADSFKARALAPKDRFVYISPATTSGDPSSLAKFGVARPIVEKAISPARVVRSPNFATRENRDDGGYLVSDCLAAVATRFDRSMVCVGNRDTPSQHVVVEIGRRANNPAHVGQIDAFELNSTGRSNRMVTQWKGPNDHAEQLGVLGTTSQTFHRVQSEDQIPDHEA